MTMQRDAQWVKAATADEIVAAQTAGELATYLGGQTAEERAQSAVAAGSVDRVSAAAYGLSVAQAKAMSDSTFFTSKRGAMDAAQLEKLSWVESARPDEVFAAEQAGELDHLMGRDVSNEQARLAGIAAAVTSAMTGNR